MTQVLIDLVSRPGGADGPRMILTDEGAYFTDQEVYRWDSVTRIRYAVAQQRVNGAYMGTQFTIELGDAIRRSRFLMNAGLQGRLLSRVDEQGHDEMLSRWRAAVGIIEQQAGQRLVTQAVGAVLQGGEVTISRLRFDRAGVHKRGLFGTTTVRWPEVAGSETKHRYFRVLARAGTGAKARIQVPEGHWNQVLVPRIIEALGRAAR
jgi:hypothetical protein